MESKYLIIAALLLAVAGISKAAVDVLTHQAGNNIFERLGGWWDARNSWKNKYKDYNNGDLRPRFFGSKTFLVLLTDFWHLADSVYLTSYAFGSMAIAFYVKEGSTWIVIGSMIAGRIYMSLVFELFYNHIFRVKKS